MGTRIQPSVGSESLVVDTTGARPLAARPLGPSILDAGGLFRWWHGPMGAGFVGCVLRSNLRDQRVKEAVSLCISLAKQGKGWHALAIALGVGSLANEAGDLHALPTSERATRFNTLLIHWHKSETASKFVGGGTRKCDCG